MTSDRNGSEVLSRADCMILLGSAPIGRLAVSVEALPVIMPVNFGLVGGDIVIRTTAGTQMSAATLNAVVAFEVDGFDPGRHGGWSVLVQGVAEEVTDPDEVERLTRVPPVPGTETNGHFVRIATRNVSGRRLLSIGGQNGSHLLGPG